MRLQIRTKLVVAGFIAVSFFSCYYIYTARVKKTARQGYELGVGRAIVGAWDSILTQEFPIELQGQVTMSQLVAKFKSIKNKDTPNLDVLKQFPDGTDVWGNPITLDRVTDGIATQITLHSDGPNQSHDLGGADDIERKRKVFRVR